MPRRAEVDQLGLARLAAEQDKVVSREQLAYLGYDRHLVAQRVGSGRWRSIGHRVVLLCTGDPTYRQRLWVAVLHSGPDSALAGLTAAEAGGLRGHGSSTLHTVVPHGADATNLVDERAGVTVKVTQSRRLCAEMVAPARLPRRLLLPEAIVDSASAASHDEQARLLVLAPVQQRLLRAADLRAVVAARPKLARRSLITEAIGDVEGGVHSLPEGGWTRAIRRYQLPEPARQQPVQRADGTWYLDADFTPYAVGVEINGSQHTLARAVALDDHRRNVLGTRGRLVITIASHIVRRRPGVAVVATAAALLSRGWHPPRPVHRGLERLATEVGMDLQTGDWLLIAS